MTFVPFPAGAKVRRVVHDDYWRNLCRRRGWDLNKIFTVNKCYGPTSLRLEEDLTGFISERFDFVATKTLKDFKEWL